MISFVIPAHNEERLLPRTLVAIDDAATALDEPWEVVVVDDASSDGTAAVAAAQSARVVSVSYRQISAARNAGARAARGDRLIFVDADTSVSEAAVLGAQAAWREGAAAGGCVVCFDGDLPAYARFFEQPAQLIYRIVGLAAGAYLFSTRRAFEGAGGFDESVFAGEETLLSLALHRQGRFAYLSRACVVTSGRKLRAYSAGEIFGTLGRLMLGGRRAVSSREGLDLWYGPRRPDPGWEPPD